VNAILNTAHVKLINKLYFIYTDQCTNIIFTSLYEHHVTATCFSPQRAILRKYDRYIFTERSTKCVADVQFSSLSSVYYMTRQILVAAA
jgi:nicotinamide riboside kinase